MQTDFTLNKPTPIAIGQSYTLFTQGSDVALTIEDLVQGKSILIKEFYNDGLSLLSELHKHLKLKLPNVSFKEQQAYRAAYFKLSNRIVLEIVNQKLSAKKSPNIGWLEKFYPENNHFFLSFPQIQGLNSAWQWYKKGISVPMLRNKMHPYYGIYFPTRFEHLMLFDTWLKHYDGPKKTAIDVGVGSGVLSLQLVEQGFQKIFATDTNPNAIIGLTEFMGTTKLSRKIELDFGHLFGKWDKPTELIVFNPPWIPEAHDSVGIDKAMYYNKALFPEFFAEAQKRLLPDGKLVLLFSNLAQIINVTTRHPIETELAEGNRFKLKRCYTKTVKAASSKTKRDQHWRGSEIVELWELMHR